MTPIRIALLTHSLERGGSERQLCTLARGLVGAGHAAEVFTLVGGGALGPSLERDGINVNASAASARGAVARTDRLVQGLRRFNPHVVHSQLALPNILAAWTRRLVRRPVVLGVRGVLPERSDTVLRVRSLYWLEARASRRAFMTIANSEAAAAFAVERGFPTDRLTVVPNGIDIDEFRPRPDDRQRIRSEMGIADTEILVGRVGGLRPIKDHGTFLRSLALARRSEPRIRGLVIGDGAGDYRAELWRLAGALGLGDVIWLGERNDVAELTAAFDIAVSSSYSESSPNVLLEAMAVGVPCVATDVGDSRAILGDLGRVAPPRDPGGLASGILALIREDAQDRPGRAEALRSRVVAGYSIAAMVQGTEEILRAAAASATTARP